TVSPTLKDMWQVPLPLKAILPRRRGLIEWSLPYKARSCKRFRRPELPNGKRQGFQATLLLATRHQPEALRIHSNRQRSGAAQAIKFHTSSDVCDPRGRAGDLRRIGASA